MSVSLANQATLDELLRHISRNSSWSWETDRNVLKTFLLVALRMTNAKNPEDLAEVLELIKNIPRDDLCVEAEYVLKGLTRMHWRLYTDFVVSAKKALVAPPAKKKKRGCRGGKNGKREREKRRALLSQRAVGMNVSGCPVELDAHGKIVQPSW